MERPYLLHTLRGWRDALTTLRHKREAEEADMLIQHVLDIGYRWEPAIPIVQAFVADADLLVRRASIPRERKALLRLTDQRKPKSRNS